MNDYEDNLDYIATIENVSGVLKKTIQITKEDVDRWRIQSYRYIFEHAKRWYIRLYRKLFPSRSYVNWRTKQYFRRKQAEKAMKEFTERVDTFLAWGNDIQ